MGSFFSWENRSKFLRKLKKCFVICVLAILSCLTVINPISVKVTQSKFCSNAYSTNFPSLKQIIKTLFNKKMKM